MAEVPSIPLPPQMRIRIASVDPQTGLVTCEVRMRGQRPTRFLTGVDTTMTVTIERTGIRFGVEQPRDV
jgi:hypothetical protein